LYGKANTNNAQDASFDDLMQPRAAI